MTLRGIADNLNSLDRQDRIEALISIADRFQAVPTEVASRPFDEGARVPGCESEAFIWVMDQPDGSLKYYFAVENPQGISAKALASILDEALPEMSLSEIASLSDDIVFEIFGNELSMGKTMGLTGMINMVRSAANRRAAK
ncbi:MAG: SufE family protein [Armatimonadetes bacterium]|nr:SufE family protein [Armatimonadota bacterium]